MKLTFHIWPQFFTILTILDHSHSVTESSVLIALTELGWKSVSLLSTANCPLNKNTWLKLASLGEISSMWRRAEDASSSIISGNVVLCTDQKSIVDKILSFDRDPQSILIIGLADDLQTELPSNKVFYTFNDSQLCSVMTLREKGQVIKRRFNEHWEHWDMQGSTLYTTGLPWNSLISYSACDKQGKDCQAAGMIPEIMTVLARMFNFTVKYDREREGAWGLDSFNASDPSQSLGVMGQIRRAEYDIALSTWTRNEHRSRYFDFTDSFTSLRVSAMVNVEMKAGNPYFFVKLFNVHSRVAIKARY